MRMNSLDADLKKCITAIMKLEAKKAKHTEQELNSFRANFPVRIGKKKPRCYC